MALGVKGPRMNVLQIFPEVRQSYSGLESVDFVSICRMIIFARSLS